MTRSTWVAVTITVAVLVGGSAPGWWAALHSGVSARRGESEEHPRGQQELERGPRAAPEASLRGTLGSVPAPPRSRSARSAILAPRASSRPFRDASGAIRGAAPQSRPLWAAFGDARGLPSSVRAALLTAGDFLWALPPMVVQIEPAPFVVGAVGVVLGALVFAAIGHVRTRRRRPRPTALRLAKRGQAVAAIARETGLAQDAVRALLVPGVVRHGRRSRGRIFRPARISAAKSPALGLKSAR